MRYRKRLIALFIGLCALSLIAGFFSYDPWWNKVSSWRSWTLGLDLSGGSYLVYDVDMSSVPAPDRSSVAQGLRDVIERRVNLFGVREPRVFLESSGDTTRLVVELAGIRDVSQAIQMIGATPFLEFREVVAPVGLTETATDTVAFAPTELNGRFVKGAQLGFSQTSGLPEVQIEFTGEGGDLFADITGRNVGKPVAIFLDGELIEMPVVEQKIIGGKAQITGKFSVDEARTLVERFNAGALPAPITLVHQQTVGSDFGSDALHKAVAAGLIGTLAVALFMILYYRVLGIFAAIALAMYIALTLGIFKIVPVTLTLAGIAGFILSIGMAVDANILVFARTKEELKRGLSRKEAIEEGFRRAWTSIRDSNISTMITAGVLYMFTSSFVRGFALTLFIGVLVSMLSAITITRTLLSIFLVSREEEREAARPVAKRQ